MLPSNKLSRGSVLSSFILTILFLTSAIWVFLNRDAIFDQIAYWRYEPTAQMQNFAVDSGMGQHGTFLFFASHPNLESTQKFNELCDRKESGTAVLGCYTGRQIHIYDVKDERLNGIEEVTAAHEMLHVAYQRLSGDERARIDKLVEIEYEKLKNSADYKERMAFYARTEPGQRANELHSMIGTEIANISPELEKHYSKYFVDRSRSVKLYEQYQAVFHELDARAKAIFDELELLGAQIKADSNRYNSEVVVLNNDIKSFNSRAKNGGFSSSSQFDSERAALETRSNQLSALRSKINSSIALHEAKRQEYNNIAHESTKLINSIDSSLAPTPEV